MTLDRKILFGKLNITIKGTILNNLGGIRGINPLDSYPGTVVKATRVIYSDKEGFPYFIFHQDLPLNIEGMEFEFWEVYPGEKEKDPQGNNITPIRQGMLVYAGGERKPKRIFEFHQ